MAARHDAMRVGRLKLLALAAVLGAAVCVPAGPAGAAIGGFSARPARFNPRNPVTRAYFREEARPGQTLTEQALVANASRGQIRLRVYPVDGLTGVTSGAVFGNAGDQLRRAGSWVKPRVGLVTLAPGADRVVNFVVQVPAHATPGDHLAGLAFENAQHARSGGRFSITQIIRVVVGVEIEVPGPAGAQVRLDGVGLRALPGTQIPSVIVRLGDSGRRLCKPALAVSLVGPQGRQPVVRRRLDTILPGDTIPFPLPWPRPLRAGTYSISAAASDCGRPVALRGVAHLGAPLRGTKAAPGSLPPQAAGTPWLLIVGVAVGGLLLGALIARRRPSAPNPTR